MKIVRVQKSDCVPGVSRIIYESPIIFVIDNGIEVVVHGEVYNLNGELLSLGSSYKLSIYVCKRIVGNYIILVGPSTVLI